MCEISVVMEGLRNERFRLIEQEREAAMKALARHIHENIEPDIAPDTPNISLFGSNRKRYEAVFDIPNGASNCANARAAKWVLDELLRFGYIKGTEENASLVREGIKELTE